VEKVRWSFLKGNEWVEEWPEGSERLRMVRLQFLYDKMPGTPVDVLFWIPPLTPPQNPTQDNNQIIKQQPPGPNEKP
jgi:hypothetical protein